MRVCSSADAFSFFVWVSWLGLGVWGWAGWLVGWGVTVGYVKHETRILFSN